MLIRLKQYLEEHNLLYKSQYGFRENHSTKYAALELIDHISNNLDNGKVPFSIFLDLSKAFDTLDHTSPTQKLKHYGIKGCALKLLKNYLSNRKQYVELNNVKSEMCEIKTGVPQGSILGPLLFVIYVNDIYKASSILHAIIYADDTTLTANLEDFSAKTRKDLENKINSEINKINIWLKANCLSLNIHKSKFMLYYKPTKRVLIPVLKINNTEITSVDTFNFLGLLINKNLNWKPHVEKTAGKISKAIGVINRLKCVVPQNILVTLYNSLILSHINYCTLAWGYEHKRITKLQKKAIRIIHMARYSSHTDPLFKKIRSLKFKDLFELNILKFYYKLMNNNLPDYFLHLSKVTRAQTHSYNTRFRNNVRQIQLRHKSRRKCLHYEIARIANNTPPNFLEKVYTHSYNGLFYI